MRVRLRGNCYVIILEQSMGMSECDLYLSMFQYHKDPRTAVTRVTTCYTGCGNIYRVIHIRVGQASVDRGGKGVYGNL